MIDLVDKFVRGSLDAAGAVVEPEDDILRVLLPAEAAAALSVDEELCVTTAAAAAESDAAGARAVVDASLGSAFLDRLVGERLARPVVTALSVRAEPARALSEDVPVLLNAVRRDKPERTRRPARYALADLLLTLHGDETRSAVVATCIRLADGARVATFSLTATRPAARGDRALTASECAVLGTGLGAFVGGHGLDPFRATLEGVARRARRDLERLADYYLSLDREMARAVKRARTDAEKARRRAKRELLPAELAARKEQLRERLRPRLGARLLALRFIETEIDSFCVPVQRRAHSGSITVIRRAGDGRIEGPLCAACKTETLRLYLCDEHLHVLCAECGREGRIDPSRCGACSPGRRARLASDAATGRSIVVEDAAELVIGA